MQYQGLSLPHLYLDQETKKTPGAHHPKNNVFTVLGTNVTILRNPTVHFSQPPPKYMGQFLSKYKKHIERLNGIHQIKLEHDLSLMDDMAKKGISSNPLKEFNKCKKYLHAYTLSDIVNGSGYHNELGTNRSPNT